MNVDDGKGQVGDKEERARTRTRLHILDGILDALDRMDDINNAVRVSSDRIAAREVLQGRSTNPKQSADRFLDLTIGRQTMAGVEGLHHERRKAAAAQNEGE